MPIEYKYIPSDDSQQDFHECASCGCVAPLYKFKGDSIIQPREDYFLCELCASTAAGNAHAYPNQYREGGTLKHICAVGNLILDKVCGRSPKEKTPPSCEDGAHPTTPPSAFIKPS